MIGFNGILKQALFLLDFRMVYPKVVFLFLCFVSPKNYYGSSEAQFLLAIVRI